MKGKLLTSETAKAKFVLTLTTKALWLPRQLVARAMDGRVEAEPTGVSWVDESGGWQLAQSCIGCLKRTIRRCWSLFWEG